MILPDWLFFLMLTIAVLIGAAVLFLIKISVYLEGIYDILLRQKLSQEASETKEEDNE